MNDTPAHKQVSVARYLYQNVHLLGFERQNRIINTVVRELVDNSQDQCLRRSIAPTLQVQIQPMANSKAYRVRVKDNGPGIGHTQVPKIAGQVLYGDKFVDKVSLRGQQGLGLKGIVLYSMKSLGLPIRVVSKTAQESVATVTVLSINLEDNTPLIHQVHTIPADYFPEGHGFEVTASVKAIYTTKGASSTLELIKRYVYLNPSLQLTFIDQDGPHHYPRTTTACLRLGTPIKKIPHHIEVGDLYDALRTVLPHSTLLAALNSTFEGGLDRFAQLLRREGMPSTMLAGELVDAEIDALHQAMRQEFQSMTPPQGTLPLLNEAIKTSVTQNYDRHYDTVIMHHSPTVFCDQGLLQVQVCAFYGGELPQDQKIIVQRVSNGSPLTHLASSCAITHTIHKFPWKRYNLDHTQGELPRGPMLLLVHVLGTRILYTGPGKDAIADRPQVAHLIHQGLRVIGKAIKRYRHRQELKASRQQKLAVITKTLPELLRVLTIYRGRLILDNRTLSQLCARIMDSLLMIRDPGQLQVINGSVVDYQLSVGKRGRSPADNPAYGIQGGRRMVIPFADDEFIQGLNPQEYLILPRKAWGEFGIISPSSQV